MLPVTQIEHLNKPIPGDAKEISMQSFVSIVVRIAVVSIMRSALLRAINHKEI